MNSQNNLILNKFFTEKVFLDLMNNKSNNDYTTIIENYTQNYQTKTNGELIRDIYYQTLHEFYRNEYYYQNTLWNSLFRQNKEQITTLPALRQQHVGMSIADMIHINKNTFVYEIKSDLDTLNRLQTQINDYYKAFKYVSIITSEQKLHSVLKAVRNTPIEVLTLNNHISLNIKKTAEENETNLTHKTMFNILRKKEYSGVIDEYFGKIPNARPVFFYDECFKLFSKIPKNEAHDLMIKQLKSRNFVIYDNLKYAPSPMKSLIYFSKSLMKRINDINHFLAKPYTSD